MNIQNSYQPEEHAALYVVPTPIGNLEDMTFRAIRVLKECNLIAAEDTRNTKKLLHYFEIHTPLISYHEHNHQEREKQLLDTIRQGESVAVVSDAGMPAISDPGSELVQAAIQEGLDVIVLPGANAALVALVGSGLTAQPFTFYGFLPRKKKDKKETLEKLKNFNTTLIFYESPYRIKDTLQEMEGILNDRKAAIGREISKKFEEFVRGTIQELFSWSKKNDMRGEFVIVVEGPTEAESASFEQESSWWEALSVKEHVEALMDKEHLSSKEAIKQAAIERKVPKREVYQSYHID
ncbi:MULTISPECIES: 16S rRNA (cytidine(1402)-2'-O)-methyltransferase [Oceanobacillus]|uniref:Ribosomal RNA small subunit methyltransferase I n=1 Tax=Oceanobacillus aidingensis TaxID=645964 RepID=A0ABV9JTF6_9BACI|nr:16S rRNA (cytidine(1402)-2'-O)-methyltransferase [Oceanobacillus oncorhynchi]MDM8101454.1 16S rRNA (cytidine(1402)-2'-O)-methyltransferase [Oceanobacillus oncorhynchi]